MTTKTIPAAAAATPAPIRIFHIQPGAGATELDALPAQPPPVGFYWVACTRAALQQELARLQAMIQTVTGLQLVDLHVTDLLSTQLPSHYDYTSQYDLLVMRQLAATEGQAEAPLPRTARGGPPVLRRIDTSPVALVVFDALLLSVHPHDCTVRDSYARRLTAPPPPAPPPLDADAAEAAADTLVCELSTGAPVAGVRLPGSTADLMLRLVNQIVDNYLELRRDLSRQLDHWQVALLNPRGRFNHWRSLMVARLALHHLADICEDQRAALQAWSSALDGGRMACDDGLAQRELELLKVRSRDVLEHIARVAQHVRRLEQSTEAAVQMHFSVQNNRTNDIMRVLTVLTAVFLPLNLIAGIFGMNFEVLPFVELHNGFWGALLAMLLIAAALTAYFWRNRYLAQTDVER
ncbi:magnesium transporter CorA family protein [Melaminivora jejuensis]|uniref:magnesium transporter CorA family protein n=1 Tax=Melaminivora jejuensis TaxID=1267217 RepID=UPI001E5C9C29|nr:magnesium transporter CorA family protein [Melaminivora jejuensis]UHJ65173.1 magnesium transporter CorA family protein [Melaminivora jejuensis]